MIPRQFNRRRSPLWFAVVGLALLVEWYAPPRGYSLAFWGFVITALQFVVGAFNTAANAIAVATVAAVQWLVASLSWLTTVFWKFVRNTGGMFSKVWESGRKFWFDVLRPAVIKITEWVRQAREWLIQKVGPVFKLLDKVRARIRRIYETFVRPVLDVIDVARSVLGVLSRFGVEWAKALDARLAEYESVITKNYLRLNGYVNAVIGTINRIVTAEFLFQQIPFLRTMQRDVRAVWRLLINSGAQVWHKPPAPHIPTTDEIRAATEEALLTGRGKYGPLISEMESIWRHHLDVP